MYSWIQIIWESSDLYVVGKWVGYRGLGLYMPHFVRRMRAKRATTIASNACLTKRAPSIPQLYCDTTVMGPLYKNPLQKVFYRVFEHQSFTRSKTSAHDIFFTKYQQITLFLFFTTFYNHENRHFVSIHYNPIHWDTFKLHFRIVHVLLHYRLFWFGWKRIITRDIARYSSFYNIHVNKRHKIICNAPISVQ